MTKVELASPEWMSLMRAQLMAAASNATPDTRFSVTETFTDVPPHLDRHGNGQIAWHCVIEGQQVRFGETALAEADIKSRADYVFILPVARRIYTPEVMEEVAAYKASGVKQGKYLSAVRDGVQVPAFLREVHNEMARRTL